MSTEAILKALDAIEAKMNQQSEKAAEDVKTMGKVSEDTKAAINNIGIQQREFADRLSVLEQKGFIHCEGDRIDDSWGTQFTKSDAYIAFAGGNTQKARIEVKNTLTGSDATVAPDRKPGIVPGASTILNIESLFTSIPTSSNAIEFTKEASFTNNAAETAEGVLKPESALTFSLVNMPVSTVAHWIKISRQLAMDNSALAAYVNTRMRYGVNKKVDTQLVVGTGVAPALSGFMKSGNYTAHGYLSGALGSTLPKFVLIRKVIGDLKNSGYVPNAIVMNPVDWATMETELLTTAAGQVPFKYDEGGTPRLFGLPVVEAVGMTADTFAVGSFNEAATIHNREGVVVELSDSDDKNFQMNLITIRAERRLALTVEVPAAIRGGDLTPAAA
ncbi:MAG: phage major capsid protein [Advenella sp.]|uniref:phage major capsid protein n=1 Tax=Advenella sp. TaxID=1872388 RepID=UPI0025897D60|nr:phage major capsid protein [Advenella sp.]MDD3757697.1 phage major capsid protein [Advenella sp.]